MQLNPSQGRVLKSALDVLGRGDPKRFDDELWLGFGDDCQSIWDALIQGRYVESAGSIFQTRLTPRGVQLLRRLASL
ncbi:MAG: hypothetical protein HRU70_00970 [Phycisphaeraceae bacterium]|nr:MAG: hypothetical protein HRU70_00970 [Phycisphaeraceae bacterium]